MKTPTPEETLRHIKHTRWFLTHDQQYVYTYIERHVNNRLALEMLESSLETLGIQSTTIRGVDIPFPNGSTIHSYLITSQKDSFWKVLGGSDMINSIKITDLVLRDNKLVTELAEPTRSWQEKISSKQNSISSVSEETTSLPEDKNDKKRPREEETTSTKQPSSLQKWMETATEQQIMDRMLHLKKRWLELHEQQEKAKQQKPVNGGVGFPF